MQSKDSDEMEIDRDNQTDVFIKSLSSHSKYSKGNLSATMKLKYDEIIEEKNQRIARLESKNMQYLSMIT